MQMPFEGGRKYFYVRHEIEWKVNTVMLPTGALGVESVEFWVTEQTMPEHVSTHMRLMNRPSNVQVRKVPYPPETSPLARNPSNPSVPANPPADWNTFVTSTGQKIVQYR
jgi:hypothetical protein